MRQLRRVGLDPDRPPESVESWRAFLARVHQAYADLEAERYTRERSMELVTAEMQELYARAQVEQERLQELIRYLGNGLVSLDAEGRARMVNPDATLTFGWAEADLLGSCVFDALRPAGPDGAPLPLLETLRAGAATRSNDATFRHKDGSRVPVAFVLNAVERDGVVLGGYLVFHDIRQRKAAEAGMQRARELAELADRTKSEFVATMSHELGTPLNGVIGMLELLGATELDEVQRECVRAASASAGGLAAIVRDVLDFSRLEAGQLAIELSAVEPHSLVSELLADFADEAAPKSLELRLDWRAGELPRLAADAQRVRQVLANLVGNAVKFTERGGVTVTVERTSESDDTVTLRFEIRDTGPGIRADQQARLFEKFWQEDGSYARRHGGTGLGLAICKRLVEAMEGRIGASSTPGEGSTFWFELTLTRDRAAVAGPAAGPVEPVHFAGKRVLVVEDTPVNQKITMRLLERSGCVVELARDGREAVTAYMRGGHELVLMDCQMPGMDGFEATALIRRHEGERTHVPIVALTANAQPADRERCLAAGMDDFLAKPLQAEALQRMMSRWLGRRAA
ncbi:MAG: ATP-binding protein [Candidatus Eisenbacteria bacterium]